VFAQKLVREARERAAALKHRLVELYNQLQKGDVPEAKREELARAIKEINGKLEADTRRLGGQTDAPADPKPGTAQKPEGGRRCST
jgi:acyl-CoA reductase-like NAD-dependent aldehyde dehydrogenase